MDFLQQQQQLIVKILSANSPSHNALAACGLVTIVPLLLVMLLPAKLPNLVMTILVGFAVGTLLGDIFLHVIPFVMEQHSEHGHHDHSSHHHHTDNHHHDSKQESHSHNHAHTIGPMLAILAGLICFMIVDKLIRSVSGGHHHHHHHHHDDHSSHSTSDTAQDLHSAVQSADMQKKSSTSSMKATKVNVTELRKRKAESTSSVQSQDKALNGPPSHQHHHHHHQSSAGYLSILSSLAHTFTDGLTLSISHYASPSIAASTTFAIFLHEIPHKVSDYAILIQSGFSKPVAVLMQMWSAMGTVLGVLFGIWIQGEQAASVLAGFEKSVIPFSAGGLIYTATVAILPELLEASDVSIFEFMLQICSMCCGVYLMALIALNE
ncbi:hypothetical protein MIR68_006621 [Amoeboaphelidium protococcarum]|nr:hypothetical protein MIR68_006621 [Amoeboaphelidium protococcarum]